MNVEYTSVNRVKDSAVSPNWRVYSHDVRGNVTDDDIHTFTYDYANQPITIGGTDSGTYAYDGNLKRVKQVVGGQTIYSIYDREKVTLSGAAVAINWRRVTFSTKVDQLVNGCRVVGNKRVFGGSVENSYG